ncbi:MAG: ferredoxin Fer [Natronomonas sp.]
MGSPYDVLSVSSDADDEELESAYRQRIKETHPDLGGSVEAFLRVKTAYETILEQRAGSGRETDFEKASARADWYETDRGQSASRGPTWVSVEYLDYAVLDDHGWDLDDSKLFEKAAAAGLESTNYGTFDVKSDETLLEAAENHGFAWPYACRGGACANCAVAVCDGDLSTPVNHVLPPDMVDRGIRLSCVGKPTTDELQVVFNVKHLPVLDELRLPPRPFEDAYARE